MFNDLGIKDAQVQPTDQNTLMIRFSFIEELDQAARQKIITGDAFADKFNDQVIGDAL